MLLSGAVGGCCGRGPLLLPGGELEPGGVEAGAQHDDLAPRPLLLLLLLLLLPFRHACVPVVSTVSAAAAVAAAAVHSEEAGQHLAHHGVAGPVPWCT